MERLLLGPIPAMRLLTSFVLALLLWGLVTTQRDPIRTRTLTGIDIAAPSLVDPLLVVGELGTVSVRLKGPRSLVEEQVASDLRLTLDVDDITEPGSYNVEVRADALNALDVESIDPPRLVLLVDERRTASFHVVPIRPVLPGDNRRVREVTIEPSEVNVTGPGAVVDRVDRVEARVEIGERTASFTATVTLEALDAGGNAISEVEIVPSSVTAAVALSTSGKSVTVLTFTDGTPADGYEVIDRTVNPSTLVLDGPAEALADVFAVTTEPVAIDGVTGNVSRQVGIADLPPEVRVVDPADGMVTVVVQVRQRGVEEALPPVPLVVVGAAPGLDATVEPAALSVTVIASEAALTNLRAGDVLPSVDVTGRPAGTYLITPSVAVPRDMQWTRTDPGQVRVTLVARADTGAPASPTPPPRP